MTETKSQARRDSGELAALLLPELRKVATNLGIEGAKDLKKPDLVKAIADLQAANRESARAEREARRAARMQRRNKNSESEEEEEMGTDSQDGGSGSSGEEENRSNRDGNGDSDRDRGDRGAGGSDHGHLSRPARSHGPAVGAGRMHGI